jgi:DNA-binding MarR family transcriptional regulator
MFRNVALPDHVWQRKLRNLGPRLSIHGWKVNKPDVIIAMQQGDRMQEKVSVAATGGESLLFLTDDQLRRGIEAMFFAYRAFTADPDLILADMDYGRAHHRAIHFVHREPGLTVTALLDVLGVTKQSLNRVLRTLIDDGLIESRIGRRDRRERQLYLTDKGASLERRLSETQRARMRAAYRAAGPQAVTGFRQVLEAMMDRDTLRQYRALKDLPETP